MRAVMALPGGWWRMAVPAAGESDAVLSGNGCNISCVGALAVPDCRGANSITAYYLEDNKQWNSSVFNILQNDIYFCIVLFQLLYPRTQEAKKVMKVQQ